MISEEEFFDIADIEELPQTKLETFGLKMNTEILKSKNFSVGNMSTTRAMETLDSYLSHVDDAVKEMFRIIDLETQIVIDFTDFEDGMVTNEITGKRRKVRIYTHQYSGIMKEAFFKLANAEICLQDFVKTIFHQNPDLKKAVWCRPRIFSHHLLT